MQPHGLLVLRAEDPEILRKRRRYRKISEYIQGLARYDAQTQREQCLSAESAALSPAERDVLDAAFLKQVKAGEGTRGSWLEARIYEIIMQVYRTADYAAKRRPMRPGRPLNPRRK
jgi:hypothetical protein